jgi:hypothetical protein
MLPRTTAIILLPVKGSREYCIKCPSFRTVLGPSQIPEPTVREEQHHKLPSEQTEELEECGNSDKKTSSKEQLWADIPEQSESSEDESSEEEPPVNPEHHLEIEIFISNYKVVQQKNQHLQQSSTSKMKASKNQTEKTQELEFRTNLELIEKIKQNTLDR